MIELHVHIETASVRWNKAFPRLKAKAERAARQAFAYARKPAAFKDRVFEVNIILATDARVKKLNSAWRGKDKATNVLSFPQIDMRAAARAMKPFPPGAAVPLGDVILARETVGRECRAEGKALENHTIHLIVHGILHLLGYDHIRPQDAKAMEKLEIDILRVLGYPAPYHDPAVKSGRITRHA